MAWNREDCTWEPYSNCHTGIEETIALIAGAVAPTSAAAGGFAGLTAAELAGLGVPAAAGAGTAAFPTLGALSTAATVGGTAASFIGTQQAAQARQQEAYSQATALQARAAADRVQAGQEAASSQRLALNERRKTQLVLSRQQAVAAAGGGYATDPSTLTLGADIGAQGEYNALSQLAAGQTREAALKYQSDIDAAQAARYQQAGAMAPTTGLYAGAGTLFSGLGTLATNQERRNYYRDRYGGY
jgi:hypothetical protein